MVVAALRPCDQCDRRVRRRGGRAQWLWRQSIQPADCLGPGSSSLAGTNPAGDFPDNQAFVAYTAPDGSFKLKVPGGLARITSGSEVVFTDKFSSVTLAPRNGFYPPTESFTRSVEVPQILSTAKGFALGEVTTAQSSAGQVVLITYRVHSPPSPVTGRSVSLDVERSDFSKAHGHRLIHLAVVSTLGTTIIETITAHDHSESAAMEAHSLYRFFRAGEEETLDLRGVSATLAPQARISVAFADVGCRSRRLVRRRVRRTQLALQPPQGVSAPGCRHPLT
jgi:hypothetical protein